MIIPMRSIIKLCKASPHLLNDCIEEDHKEPNECNAFPDFKCGKNLGNENCETARCQA